MKNLVVKETQAGVRKDHIVFIRSLDALRVHDTAAGGGQVLDAASERPVNVIGEGEERIA